MESGEFIILERELPPQIQLDSVEKKVQEAMEDLA